MPEKRKAETSRDDEKASECCRVEAIVGIDERGQMVLPKDLREKAGLVPGDKLAVISCREGGSICCLTLIKADDLAGRIKDILGPMLKGLTGS